MIVAADPMTIATITAKAKGGKGITDAATNPASSAPKQRIVTFSSRDLDHTPETTTLAPSWVASGEDGVRLPRVPTIVREARLHVSHWTLATLHLHQGSEQVPTTLFCESYDAVQQPFANGRGTDGTMVVRRSHVDASLPSSQALRSFSRGSGTKVPIGGRALSHTARPSTGRGIT